MVKVVYMYETIIIIQFQSIQWKKGLLDKKNYENYYNYIIINLNYI